MLDAHKRSVVGGTSRTGVNKAKEILGARSTEKRAINAMLITLLPEIETDKEKVAKIANSIETMEFKQFVSVFQVFYEKYGEPIQRNMRMKWR